MSENDLFHLVYCSTVRTELSQDDIFGILKTSRANNKPLGITGMLLYENGSFFQVLEGKKEVVDKLYNKILHDKRHKKIASIIFEPIEERSFSSWTMGFADIPKKELNKIDGLNDFLRMGSAI